MSQQKNQRCFYQEIKKLINEGEKYDTIVKPQLSVLKNELVKDKNSAVNSIKYFKDFAKNKINANYNVRNFVATAGLATGVPGLLAHNTISDK